MELSEKFFSYIPNSITYKTTKFFTTFTDSSGKKAYFSGKRLQLLEYDPSYGKNFIQITEEQAKKKHVGKVRCLGIVYDEYQLLVIFSKYFKFEQPPVYTPPQQHTSNRSERKERKIVEKPRKLELKTQQLPSDRDEKDLISAYRLTENKREKDRIFKVILFQRGVNGKTWHQIIKNYVSYNKHKFAHFLDRTEDDFYQDIVIALQKQVEKWFDSSRNCCFSTYAWYVINCSFHRVLQLLSTQKRKVSYVKSNIDLNDSETSWDEIISIDKTQMPYSQVCFEDDFEQKNLCSYIQKMFKLREVDAPEELKQEILKVIREKSTMQNSLYSLAKKYNMEVDVLFELEIVLRENLKNAMYNDIILNMQYDINADEHIARKYKRSKGHVIKMKRQLSTLIKSKLKSMTF
jgi:hypothetical protein